MMSCSHLITPSVRRTCRGKCPVTNPLLPSLLNTALVTYSINQYPKPEPNGWCSGCGLGFIFGTCMFRMTVRHLALIDVFAIFLSPFAHTLEQYFIGDGRFF
jgi:hypothetical protein